MLAWGAWTVAYLLIWGRYFPDAPSIQLLQAWGIAVGVAFVVVEPAAILLATPVALARNAGVNAMLPGLRWLPGRSTLRGSSLVALVREHSLSARLQHLTLLRATGHASYLWPHTTTVALAPSWLLAAIMGTPPRKAASSAGSTESVGNSDGTLIPGMGSADEARHSLMLRAYGATLLRLAAAKIK